MRKIDYFYLSSLNLKRNKSRTIIAIFSLTIGLLFSTLALFVIFAFYFGSLGLDYDMKFNSITFSHNYDFYGGNHSTIEDKKIYDNFDGIENIMTCNSVGIYSNSNAPMYINYDNNTIISEMRNPKAYAIDNFDSKYIEKYALHNTGKPFIIAGKGKVEKNEILLSQNFLASCNLSLDIVGKDITIKTYYLNINSDHDKVYYKDGNEVIENSYSGYYYLFKNYKVVGVFNNQGEIRNGLIKYIYPYDADIIFNGESRYVTNIEIVHENRFKHSFFYYDKPIEELIKEAELNNLVLSYSPITSNTDIIQFKSFKYTNNAYHILKNELSYDVFDNEVIVDHFFEKYIPFHTLITSICNFLSIFGIMVLIISILNIFNVINNDISRKKKNMGMLKSLGFKNKDIFRLKLIEFDNYLIRSALISFIVGLVISIAFTIYVNKKIDYEPIGFNVNAKFDFWYYFIAFFVVIVILFFISYIYTLIVTRIVVKEKPINLLKKR